MAKRQAAGAPVLRPPYGDMVTRTHELCLALIGQAQAGNENGVKTMAEQLMAQVGALVSLMSMKGEKMAKRKVRPTARGYIRKNREAILKLLWDCQTDLRIIGEDYHAWCRVFESDRGNAVQILKEFFELIKKLYYCHKDRCSDKHCCVKKDIWFRWRSLACCERYR